MFNNANVPFTGNENMAPMPNNVSPAMYAPTPSYVAPTYMAPTYAAPTCVYGYAGGPSQGYGGFTLIVVLFILLIIVGASFCQHGKSHHDC